MPFSVRARIAIVFSALVGALVLIFAVVLQGVHVAQQLRATEESARSLAVRIGTRIVTANAIGDTLLTVVDSNRSPPIVRATTWLNTLLAGVPHYVFVLAGDGHALTQSYDARVLPPAQRDNLDSIAASVIPGQSIRVGRDGIIASDPFFSRVTSIPLQNGRMIAYAVSVSFTRPGVERTVVGALRPPPPTIDRVVVAQVVEPTRFRLGDVLGPLLILGPLIAVAGIGAAHYATSAAYRPIGQLIADSEAVSDGRSLHRRLAIDEDADAQLVRLTDTLNAMIARLEASFASLRRFTADASHELKTPLTVLRADVERAMAPSTKPTERLEALEEALAETARMANLVESLLTLARADEGRFDLHREPVDLVDLARDVFETALLLGEPKGVRVEMDAPSSLMVLGDRDRLRQLWLNLIENAIKYSPKGGAVALRLAIVDDFARFTVADTGIGIAAADLPHVFDRFWRADLARSRSSERGGFGLGLAISQYIAQAHGGSLSVRSRLGRGSTFICDLPLATAEPPQLTTNSTFINS